MREKWQSGPTQRASVYAAFDLCLTFAVALHREPPNILYNPSLWDNAFCILIHV